MCRLNGKYKLYPIILSIVFGEKHEKKVIILGSIILIVEVGDVAKNANILSGSADDVAEASTKTGVIEGGVKSNLKNIEDFIAGIRILMMYLIIMLKYTQII